MKQDEYDVIVVGGGGSGLAAAVSAAEHGARVLMLEKNPYLGGTTGIAVGSFTASRTSYQRRAGIDDNPRDHEADAAQFGPVEIQASNDKELRQFFLEHAGDTLDWLTAMGLRFFGPSPEPPNRVPRMHNVVPNAKAYIATLHSRLTRLGADIECNCPVTRLLVESGRVTGVEARRRNTPAVFRAARGVVLAAGDYANAPEIIGRYKGAEFSVIEGINPNATGDGQRLAEQAGAALVNMQITYGPELRFIPPAKKPFTQLLPTSGLLGRMIAGAVPLVPRAAINVFVKRLLVTWQHPENSLFDDGAVLINALGERFCDERVSPAREIAIAHQPGKLAYILLDQRLAERYGSWPHFISTAPEIAYAYVNDYLRLRPDVASRARSLDQLAALRTLPATALQATIDAFNRSAIDGTPDRWGRSDNRKALAGDNWILLGPVKSYFTTTEGGAAINQRFQALDANGIPIDGLFAVGQNGLGGQVLWGHGLHIAWALTSGRLVGQILGKAS
jgi:succinate dehydrogenase/fumarate reductase flavoprotein subunit